MDPSRSSRNPWRRFSSFRLRSLRRPCEDRRPCSALVNVPREKTPLHGCVMRQRERTEVEADEVTMKTAGTCWWGRAFAFVELMGWVWVMGNTFLVRHLASLTFKPSPSSGDSGLKRPPPVDLESPSGL